MLSPKQTKFHVLRYVNTCSSAAMSGDNSLQVCFLLHVQYRCFNISFLEPSDLIFDQRI